MKVVQELLSAVTLFNLEKMSQANLMLPKDSQPTIIDNAVCHSKPLEPIVMDIQG